MSVTWVVAADSSRARIFSLESRIEPMSELVDMVHAEGRLQDQDALSDRQGGIAGGHGEGGGGHSFESPTDGKHHEAEVFAKQIADKLEQGRLAHDYHKLILIAPPAFLGVLRQVLNQHIQDLVCASLDKNLIAEKEAVIREHIL